MKKLLFTFLAFAAVQIAFSQARVNIIHNSADAAATEVDVYLDDALAVDNFAFRTETGFIDFPADVEVVIGIAPPTSTGSGDAIATFPVTLANGETYVVVADGIVSPTGYDPAPAFGLAVYAMGRESATVGTNTDVLVHHGSTDAPAVDVYETGVGAGLIVPNISYTEFAGYLELATADYVLQINAAGGGGVAAFGAPLATLGLEGAALVVVASGFLNPANNSNGPAFGLWVATGSAGNLVELPSATLGGNDFDLKKIALYPNPTSEILNFQSDKKANYVIQIVDMQGRILLQDATAFETGNINVSFLSAGIYNVLIVDNNKVIGSTKFVKN
ncbi:MAG: T9SS type A sorting domain-containing protein [Flavobacteriaceae bacterium]